MASLDTKGNTVSLLVPAKGETVDINLSGTYNMVIKFQRERGSYGSGAWETLETYSTEDATVAEQYVTKEDNEHLRLIVATDTSGTVVATLASTSVLPIKKITTPQGDTLMDISQDGVIFYDDQGNVLLDTRLGEQVIFLGDANANILAANSGKTHVIANVSADRTFTLPAEQDGLHFKFVAQVGAADGHDWIFASTGLMHGGLLVIDTDAGPAVASAVVADQSDDNALQVNVPQGGTVVEFYCNGTVWVVSGQVLATAVPVFS